MIRKGKDKLALSVDGVCKILYKREPKDPTESSLMS